MIDQDAMRELIRALYRKGANEDEIEAVVTVLETESNILEMLNKLKQVKSIRVKL